MGGGAPLLEPPNTAIVVPPSISRELNPIKTVAEFMRDDSFYNITNAELSSLPMPNYLRKIT